LAVCALHILRSDSQQTKEQCQKHETVHLQQRQLRPEYKLRENLTESPTHCVVRLPEPTETSILEIEVVVFLTED